MIPVKCVLLNTLDKYTKEVWPTRMVTRPLKGDTVKSESGKQCLKVVNITHTTEKIHHSYNNYDICPVLEVYLGL